MYNFIECVFEPKEGGAKFNVKNIDSYSFNVSRTPGPNGHIGMRGHEIGYISIRRKKSLQDEGRAQLEDETVNLAAATEKRAYFKGEITLARADDAGDKIQTLRWDDGHICNLHCEVFEDQIIESFDVSVTKLMVDNAEFKRVHTT